MIVLPALVLAIALLCYAFLAWARKQGYVAPAPRAAVPASGHNRGIPPVAEALAYVGIVLLLAGGTAAFVRQWSAIGRWGHAAICFAAAALFVTVGAVLRTAHDPALQRVADVVWFLSLVGVAGAAGSVANEMVGLSGQLSLLIVGICLTGWASVLWVVRRHAGEHAALFASVVITTCGLIAVAGDGHAPASAFAMTLWALGIVWTLAGWERWLTPIWVAMPLGLLLALIAPSIAAGDHGWAYAVGICSAAAVMAASLPLHNTPMLALGTVALFGYVTAVVLHYFADALGVPVVLSLTGVLVLLLAATSPRLVRMTQQPRPPQARTSRPLDHHR